MKNLSMSGRSLGIQFMEDYHSPFITILTQADAEYLDPILFVGADCIACERSQQEFDTESPQQMELLLIKVQDCLLLSTRTKNMRVSCS